MILRFNSVVVAVLGCLFIGCFLCLYGVVGFRRCIVCGFWFDLLCMICCFWFVCLFCFWFRRCCVCICLIVVVYLWGLWLRACWATRVCWVCCILDVSVLTSFCCGVGVFVAVCLCVLSVCYLVVGLLVLVDCGDG